MLGFVIIAPLCLQNLSTVQLISWNLNEFPQFSIQRQVENNWLPWQHLRTKENFKTCKIILNGVKNLVKFLYSILSRLGVIEKSSLFRRIPPPPRLDRVNESSSGSAGRLVPSVEIEIKHLNIPELDEDENSEIEQDEHDMTQTNIDCILEESQNEECSGDDDQSDDMTT